MTTSLRGTVAITLAAALSTSTPPVMAYDENMTFLAPGITTDIMRSCAPFASAAYQHYIAQFGPKSHWFDGTVGPATEARAREELAREVWSWVTTPSREQVQADLRRWPHWKDRAGGLSYYNSTRFMKCAWQRRLVQLDAGPGRAGRKS